MQSDCALVTHWLDDDTDTDYLSAESKSLVEQSKELDRLQGKLDTFCSNGAQEETRNKLIRSSLGEVGVALKTVYDALHAYMISRKRAEDFTERRQDSKAFVKWVKHGNNWNHC